MVDALNLEFSFFIMES